MYMFWTALGCLNQMISSVLWNGSTGDRAPIWCDICMCRLDPLCLYLLTSFQHPEALLLWQLVSRQQLFVSFAGYIIVCASSP